MPDKILHKRSLTPGAVPDTGSLELGELAINVADGKVHLRRSGSSDDVVSLVTANIETTGSIIATSFSGSFSGSGANLSGIPASGIVGLNLSQIATGSITAAVNVNSASFAITSGSSTFLFVSSSGNVGLGTTTPETRLHIQVPGVNNFREPILKMSVSDAGNDAFIISNGTSANNTFWPAFAGYGSSLTRSGLQFIALIPSSADVAGSDRGMINFEAIVTDNASNPNNGNFSSVQNRNLFTYSNFTGPFITIGPTGNFGLGTTSPTVRLDVSGSTRIVGDTTITGSAVISSSNATQMRVGSNLLFVSSSGRVGIGTTSPTATLGVNGTINASSTITADFGTGLALSSGVMSIKRVTSPLLGVELSSTSYPMGFGFTRATTAQSGVTNGLFLYNSIAFQSGSGHSYNELDINPTISEYLGASPNSIVRGVFIRPTLTGFTTTPYRAIEWNTNYGFGLFGSGSSQNLLLGNLHIGSFVTASNTLSVAGTTRISGSFNTATSGSILTVIGSGSAQPIFTVQGSQGELFSVTDSLSGSLYSVNDVSGLPILEVFSDNTIVMGNYLDPMLITTIYTGSVASGSHILYRLPTSSYDGFWFEYTVRSGSNARVGQIMGMWSGSSVNYLETTASAFGTTTDLNFMSTVSSGNMIISASTATSGWTIKGIIRSI